MSGIKTFAEHSQIGNDGVFFVICVKEDLQEMAKEHIGRELIESEIEAIYEDFNDNHEWRDELRSAIDRAVAKRK